MSGARPRRAAKKPVRLDAGEDDIALRAAIKASLAISQQPTTSASEAPVYRPTAAEWAQPLGYLQSIWAAAEPHGIVKIVPPAGWRPRDRFTGSAAVFDTKRQEVYRLQEGNSFGEVRAARPAPVCEPSRARPCRPSGRGGGPSVERRR